MFAISDGQTTAQVLLQPQSYGAEAAQAVYTVEGMYTFSGEGGSRYAKLYFSNGLLRQVLGFTTDESDGTGAPREIVAQTGDRFTVLEKWLDLDSSGQGQGEARQEGKTLTFGRQTFPGSNSTLPPAITWWGSSWRIWTGTRRRASHRYGCSKSRWTVALPQSPIAVTMTAASCYLFAGLTTQRQERP